MRPPVPFPVPTRAIRPGWVRRAAFFTLGLCAVAVRAATAPFRARRAAAASSRGQAASARRVCIVEPYGMGDAFLLQPLVRAWLDAGAEVALAARPEWAPLFPPLPGFTFVPFAPAWASPDPGGKYRRPLRDLTRAARTLAPAARGALGIDPRGDPRAISALWLAGASRVESLPVYWSAADCALPPLAAQYVPLDRNVPRRVVSRAFAPRGARYGRTSLVHLGFPRRASGAAPARPSPDLPIGLLPLTPWRGKCWPADCWAELLSALRGLGVPAAVLCGPGETAAALTAVGSGAGEGAGRVPVREVREVSAWPRELSRLAALVTVNTGPMHLADAMGVPLVVVDGASRLPLWAPEGDLSVVLHRQDLVPDAPFHPTATNGPAVQRAVMSLVRPKDVIRALETLGVLPAADEPEKRS